MNKKVIAVDIDDVLSRFTEGFIDYANKNWGSNVHFGNYTENWGEMFGISLDEWGQRALEIYRNDFFMSFGVVDGAREALEVLARDYKIICLTSRGAKAKVWTKQWLDKYFGGMIEELHFSGFYDELNGDSYKKDKGTICQALGADYLIDDQPKHCHGFVKCGGKAILFGDYPWNKEAVMEGEVVLAKCWAEVLAYFENGKMKASKNELERSSK